jgi:DNA helicase IV
VDPINLDVDIDQSRAAESAKLASLQTYLDGAYDALAAMRERTERVLAQAKADAHLTDAYDSALIQHRLSERLAAVAESKSPLTFGRIGEAVYGSVDPMTHYIGRRHVEDVNGDPVVVDWRAPVAAPFYRATFADPQGLDTRSRFALEQRTIVGSFDEDFTDPDGEAGGSGGVPDPLLVELERGRTGAMRDIVATIQAEQDAIIRAPFADLVVVQGGPGTGKTAVGLHRAAYLLYAHREAFAKRKLLVVGPNPVFLSYIAQVLPSLGETSAVQRTFETLMAKYRVRSEDTPTVRRLKGDPRMAGVIRNLIVGRIATGTAEQTEATETSDTPDTPDTPDTSGAVANTFVDLDVMTSFGQAYLPAAEVTAVLNDALSRQLSLGAARNVWRDQLIAAAWRTRLARTGQPEQQFGFTDTLRGSDALKNYLDRIWPNQTAPAVIRSLYSSSKERAFAARGLLTDAEQKLLARKASKKVTEELWTRADLALLDEANHLLTGDTVSFAHVVVDEAQDLSAMELRLVARRTPERSLTVLGDLAQATTVGAQQSWEQAMVALGHGKSDARGIEREPQRGYISPLLLGYRVPETLLAFANQLLPVAAPYVQHSRSVRTGGDGPSFVEVTDSEGLLAAVVTETVRLRTDLGLVGVLAPASLVAQVAQAFADAGVTALDITKHGAIEQGIALVSAEAAKGLEFDGVVVVEPAAIVSSGQTITQNESPSSRTTKAEDDPHAEAQGYRILFVALTRATQQVSVVHHQPLPVELRSPESQPAELSIEPLV